MNKAIYTIIGLLLILSCSQDPKTKNYSEESLKDDLMLFNDSERGLIQTFIIRQTMINEMGEMREMFGISDSNLVTLNTLSYGDIISAQTLFLNEQARQDSIAKDKEEKQRLLFEQKQDSLQKFVQISVIDVFKKESDWGGDKMCMKVKMVSSEKKRVNSLRFRVNIEDKNGNVLGSTYVMEETDSFSTYIESTWSWSRASDIYSILSGSSVDDYHYSYEILSMIYDGELMESN